MKFTAATLALVSALAAVNAQNMTAAGNSSDYATGLIAALNGAGLTALAGVLGSMPEFAGLLQQGNFSVFAPNNAAITGLASGNSTLNVSDIQSILSYHITPARVEQAALGVGANHTIVPSLLQAPLLGANQTAPLVASIGVDGQPRIRTASQNVTVGANVTYQNLLVHVVDQVIIPPMNLTETVTAAGLTGLVGALGAVSAILPVAALEAAPRLTIFAPTNAAFTNISSVIATLNASTIATVLANHVINGTVVYSTGISANATAVSAGGETFSFVIENGTVYVQSGNMTRARIVTADIPIENGVVHLIDAVLANTMSNPQAAASAAAVAATATPAAGGVGAAAAGGSTNAKAGAGFKTIVGCSTLAAVVFGAAMAIIA